MPSAFWSWPLRIIISLLSWRIARLCSSKLLRSGDVIITLVPSLVFVGSDFDVGTLASSLLTSQSGQSKHVDGNRWRILQGGIVSQKLKLGPVFLEGAGMMGRSW